MIGETVLEVHGVGMSFCSLQVYMYGVTIICKRRNKNVQYINFTGKLAS